MIENYTFCILLPLVHPHHKDINRWGIDTIASCANGHMSLRDPLASLRGCVAAAKQRSSSKPHTVT